MNRFLGILVGVGVLINALTFLMVAHYFSKDKEVTAQAPARPGGAATEAPVSPELLRKISGLESNLNLLSKKIDGLAARSTPASQVASQRPSRVRTPAGRPSSPGVNPASASDEEEPAENEAPFPPPPPSKKGESRPPPDSPQHEPAPEGEKANPPPPPEGSAPHPEGTPPGEAPAGTPPPNGESTNPSPQAGDGSVPEGNGSGPNPNPQD